MYNNQYLHVLLVFRRYERKELSIFTFVKQQGQIKVFERGHTENKWGLLKPPDKR